MRIVAIDVIRGFAVLSMMFFHIFDFFSNNLHLYGDFWFRSGLDQFNWMPMFFITVGVCLGLPTRNPKRIVKRSILYMILGALLCLWIGSLDADVVFIIGFYTLLSLPLVKAFKNHKGKFLVVIFVVCFLLTKILRQYQIYVYPFSYGFTAWISLPFIFLGYYLSDKIIGNNLKGMLKFSLLLVPLTIVSMIFRSVSFYDQTVSFVFLDSLIVCLIYFLVMHFQSLRIMKLFGFFGKNALPFFVFHWAILYKILAITQTLRTFEFFASLALTLSVLALYSLFLAKKPWHIWEMPKKANFLLKILKIIQNRNV
jgi:surface polysaccharide O-acyltransferase-like enzyme